MATIPSLKCNMEPLLTSQKRGTKEAVNSEHVGISATGFLLHLFFTEQLLEKIHTPKSLDMQNFV